MTGKVKSTWIVLNKLYIKTSVGDPVTNVQKYQNRNCKTITFKRKGKGNKQTKRDKPKRKGGKNK